ncbi:hypothetical protein AAF712_009715 [Marasmius tenuissimus]|uniref:Uncharacterized protein n=1 Tax=Marasmius tenuissimus TaxID=585030 RepID=A0ABR2ZQR0_9AGAR
MNSSLVPSLPRHLLFLLEASMILHVSASKREGNVLSRTVHKAHRFATRHSKGLADDIRVAFGAVLVSTPKSLGTGTGSGLRLLSSKEQSVLGNPVVYCKSGGARLGGSNSGGGSSGAGGSMGNGNGNSGGTSTMSGGSGGNRTDSTSSTSLGDRPTSTGGGGGSGGGQATTSTSTSTQAPTATPVNNNSPFKIDSHSGSNFFNGWNFQTFRDPTNGIVNYVDEAAARANGFLEINSAGNAIMRVETTLQVSGNRRSVRIQTQLEIDKGLWIMDSLHIPTGCVHCGQTAPPGPSTLNSTSSKASTTTPPTKQPSTPTPAAPSPPPPPPPSVSPEP